MTNIKVLALGGLDEDGKDLYCIEVNDDIFVINAGFKFPTKLTPGIDFIIANYDYLKERKDKIVAYIIFKNKKNNYGALPYIYQDCPAPVYCTHLTKQNILSFSKAYNQDTSKMKFVTFDLPEKVKIAGHEVTFFSTCAATPSCFGVSISTELGNIVFSGDFLVEYSNSKYFNFDLNTIGKIAEKPTLLLMCESFNAEKQGYCSPHNKLTPHLEKFFKAAPGRIFIAVAQDNLYHIEEVFKMCLNFNKKICFYDETSRKIYGLRQHSSNGQGFFPRQNVIEIEDVLRVKENELVILMTDDRENLYEKASLLANNEHELKQIRLTPTDTFIMGCPPTDNNEVIFTSVIDELYKSGCHVKYLTSSVLTKMHAYEEDIKMLLSLLKPKYYFPIEGYYVKLLKNAKIAIDMDIGLSHNNIFLLDNGQTLNINENGASLDFNMNGKVNIGDVMIDGIGVGDVVNEIISDRTRLSEDGVVILACGVSKETRTICFGPDVQMRGFLFLKDKDADAILKEMSRLFTENVTNWAKDTQDFDPSAVEHKINELIKKYLIKQNNRTPVVKANVIIAD